jgi:hypothetical protein
LIGGGGNDIIIDGPGNDTIDGGPGDDKIENGAGIDTIITGEGNDRIVSGLWWWWPGPAVPPRDRDNNVAADTSDAVDTLSDEGGDDTLDFSEATTGLTIDPDLTGADQAVDVGGHAMRLEGQFENLVGSALDDVVSVDPLSVPRLLQGGGGTDTLRFDAKGAWVADDGRVVLAMGYAPVAYDGFEVISGTRPCPDLAPGEWWDQVFTVAGSYPYYDPYNPGHTGMVVVGSQAQGELGNL